MKRSGGLKSVPSSSSASAHVGSSQFGRKVCGCGDQLLLLKATTAKNNGRFFFRCRNWAVRLFFFWFSDSLIFFGVVAIMNKFDTLYCRVNQIVTTFDGLMRWKLNWKGSVRLKKERMKI